MTVRELIATLMEREQDMDAEVKIGFVTRDEWDIGLWRDLAPVSYIRTSQLGRGKLQILAEQPNVEREEV